MEQWSDYVRTPPSFGSTPNSLINSSNTAVTSHVLDSELSHLIYSLGMQDTSQLAGMVGPSLPTHGDNFNENRSILVTNVHPETTEEEIRTMFSSGDSLYNIDMSNIKEGKVTLDYYDLRQSFRAKKLLNGNVLHGNVITVDYAPIVVDKSDPKTQNHGTIAIFHVKTATDDHIRAIFQTYGEIREIRSTPTNPNQKFVEFFDIRSAAKALKAKNGKYIMGTRVKIEFSAPLKVRKDHRPPIPRPQ
ncbi:hypothetical protein TVAG_272000 [Trichomonas vaginalis G3]|uniref:RRM domain-containing protein n=1 Tax=Trichomonas vaginalis (strain ATCC PRA-98 / G3) TaxID=412133 RepID=A2E5U7_TRIV3|nr:RNA binding [Trichomonas vaginalis G3]EAY12017.1 hypothetical protein TVAG_272000 [Trichomonas vaginalis G3]KAI5524754.1 RNA binding [Trichomonas vaginalis G3]|eukprot:XP_001324240.1 hypothetical protein [Trichomonas vaginalis G3]